MAAEGDPHGELRTQVGDPDGDHTDLAALLHAGDADPGPLREDRDGLLLGGRPAEDPGQLALVPPEVHPVEPALAVPTPTIGGLLRVVGKDHPVRVGPPHLDLVDQDGGLRRSGWGPAAEVRQVVRHVAQLVDTATTADPLAERHSGLPGPRPPATEVVQEVQPFLDGRKAVQEGVVRELRVPRVPHLNVETTVVHGHLVLSAGHGAGEQIRREADLLVQLVECHFHGVVGLDGLLGPRLALQLLPKLEVQLGDLGDALDPLPREVLEELHRGFHFPEDSASVRLVSRDPECPALREHLTEGLVRASDGLPAVQDLHLEGRDAQEILLRPDLLQPEAHERVPGGLGRTEHLRAGEHGVVHRHSLVEGVVGVNAFLVFAQV